MGAGNPPVFQVFLNFLLLFVYFFWKITQGNPHYTTRGDSRVTQLGRIYLRYAPLRALRERDAVLLVSSSIDRTWYNEYEVFAFTSNARPEIFEFSVASGHRKFENFGPRERHLQSFARFCRPSGDLSLVFGTPFWAPGNVFTAQGLEKRKKPKNFESRAKSTARPRYLEKR